MDGSVRWTVEFYEFLSPGSWPTEEQAAESEAVHRRARTNGARHGTPIIVSSLGEADPRINLFFRVGSMASAQPSTWRRYAHALVVWLDFLAVFGQRWDEASVGDVEAFKDWRLTDPRNPRMVAPTSFDTDRAALATFYGCRRSCNSPTKP